MQSVDVAIVGGAMTGMTLALGLSRCGLRVAVIEQRPMVLETPPSVPSQRVCALNHASEQLLKYVGAWQWLPQESRCAYEGMDVWERDSFASISFSADEYGYRYLGHIVENQALETALWERAQQSSQLALFRETEIVDYLAGENELFLTLSGNRHLSTRLLVGADGANSWLRRKAAIPLTFSDYSQHALVATIKTTEPPQHRARQVFSGDGILAFLSLDDEHHCSIVWSLAPEVALELAECDSERFNRKLAIAFDNCLGECEVVSPRRVFPLTARLAQDFVSQRVALIGDAAHTIHPLAGQGANLGFKDVITLIDEIRKLQKTGRDIGSSVGLRHFERERKYEAAQMLAAMRGFQSLFAGTNPLKKLVRDLGLSVTNQLPIVKSLFVEQATGFSELPDWLMSDSRE